MRDKMLILRVLLFAILWTSVDYPRIRAREVADDVCASITATYRLTASDNLREKRSRKAARLPSDPGQLRHLLNGKYLAMEYADPVTPIYYWLDINVSDDNNVSITNLMNFGTTVHGILDPSRLTISLPGQKLVTHESYGDLQIAPCDLDKMTYYVNDEIEFVIGADGSLTTGNWCAFVVSGEHQGKALVRYKDILYPAKATMTDYSETKDGEDKVHSYPVVFVRENKNKILIKNFYNNKADVSLTVDPEGNVVAAYTKVAVQRQPNGTEKNFFNWAVTDYVSPTNLKLNSKGVTGTYSGNKITLGRWAVSSGMSTGAIYDLLEKSEIEVPEEFVPFTNRLQLEGEGTAAKPYLIRTADDLCQLSSATNYYPQYTTNKRAFEGVHFKQTADIDLFHIPNFDPIGHDNKTAEFWGIYDGDGHTISNLNVDRRANDYAGLFGIIGKSGAVLNLNLNRPKIALSKNRAGCLAAHSEGIVKNVNVTDGMLEGGNLNIGGIIGYFKGSLTNSSFSGRISGKNYVGGLIGIGWGKISDSESRADISVEAKNGIAGGISGSLTGDTVTVKNVIAAGTIRDSFGSATIGGLSGYFQYGNLDGGVFTGHIYSKSPTGISSTSSLGGIVGMLCAGKIKNCLMAGRVESPDAPNIAGLIGKVNKRSGGTDEPRADNCLVSGSLSCKVDYHGNEFAALVTDKTVIAGCLYDNQTLGRTSEAEGGLATSRITDGTPLGSLSETEWMYSKGSYPVPRKVSSTDGGKLAAAAFILSSGDDVNAVRNDFSLDVSKGTTWRLYVNGRLTETGHGMTIDNGHARLTAEEAVCDTLMAIQKDGLYKTAYIKILPQEYDGEGTEESPYLIRSVRDISRLQNAVDVQGVRYTDTYFRLDADLDFSGIDNFIGFSSSGVDRAFNGIFDGNGHSIKNWHIDRVLLNDENIPTAENAATRMAGFFLFTGRQSVIKNLTIDRTCSITAGSHVASVVSQNYGLVENCRNYASVTGIGSEVGGLVAANYDTGVIRKSLNAGAVDCGGSYVGGILGANLGKVECCLNIGSVTDARISSESPAQDKMGAAGGLVGCNYNEVTNSINLGAVKAPRVTGGLVGENNDPGTIRNSLSLGICAETKYLQMHGAVMGAQKNNPATSENVYYDFQLAASCDGNDSSQPGVTRMTTAALTDGTLPEGLSSEIFSVSAGRYPLIKGFETDPEAIFMASAMVMFSNEGRSDTRFYMRRKAEIRIPKGTSVATQGSHFSISGNTIDISGNNSAITDTLVLIYGSAHKEIPLLSPGRLLSKGDGSESAPWLIETRADWMTVASFTDDYDVDFRDEHFRLGDNIDFAGAVFKPWFRKGESRFEGTLDGAAKSMDNIICDLSEEKTGNTGLMGTIGTHGVIKDLTLGTGCSFKGYDNVGAFAGRSAGLISGCANNSATVESTRVFCGGFAGYVLAGARFINCVNRAAIKAASGQVGGIAGGNGGEIGGEISGCYNYGKIESGTTTAGGIIGSCRLPVSNCRNEGNVYARNTSAGGIIGYQASEFAVTGCENTGTVNAGGGNSGGIVGYLFNAASVRDCVNRSNVSSSASYAGGIIGLTGMPGAKVYSCSNYGSITSGKEFAGGIVGEGENGVELQNVENHGDIVAQEYAGGILAGLKGSITNAMNSGQITTKTGFAGGLAGVVSTTDSASHISASFNVGQVKSAGDSDKDSFCIGGLIGGGLVELTDVYNISDVEGYRFVGGLIGLADAGSSIINAYNIGDVKGLNAKNHSTCGNITGNFKSETVRNVYYDRQLGSENTYPNDAAFEGKLTREMRSGLLGEAFVDCQGGAYPILKAFENNRHAIVYSSAIVLEDKDTRHNVNTDFSLMAAPSIKWTSEEIAISDGKAKLDGLPGGTYKLFAVSDDIKREFVIKLSGNDGIDNNISDEIGEPEEVLWYRLDGVKVPAPENGIYIKVSIYSNGQKIIEKLSSVK